MKDAKEQGVSRSQFAERGALVSAVGALVGFGISIFQPILDWRREALKPLIQYFFIGLTLCTPFVLGFLVFGWFIKTANESSRKVTHLGNQPRP
jgi:hypothetical protein